MSRSRALAFAAEVEEAGQQWPTNPDGIRWSKGHGYVLPVEETESLPETFHDVAISYFRYQARMMKLGHLKPYTLHRYRRAYELHLLTTFGPMVLTEIQPLDIEDWMVEQRDLPSTGKSIRNRHGLLFSILMHGQKRLGLRPDNPAELTRLPSKDSELGRQVRFFQREEWALLRSCLRSDVHLLVDVALATGMRWGELAALRRGDLSFPDNQTARIHVVRAWSKRAPDEDPIDLTAGQNRTWKLGPPKSRRSRYVVVRGQDAARLRRAVSSHDPDTYVFRTAQGNPWRYPDFHSDRWVPARNEAVRRGMTKHATPHMLRHTTVVWSLAAGVRIEVVSEQLGHASLQITYDVYGGLINLHDPVMAEAMSREMLTIASAVVPRPTPHDVDNRPIRPAAPDGTRRRNS
ncbi:tyrosine-type recombinase/integrase [Nocardioides sp. HDW12B]|uniref:tyrosine-type recombinase/integrase n=1 Tax=Nocardioides sp. HDW12B TaxID=2714939 RepID=UPI0014083177|nr:tyrosine-type recombinase/integrase [Nocardioides sp. HDW12B]QIK66413.1 tyrosine-type recombinase/integrase [Nocardioides sp. HDW12B]